MSHDHMVANIAETVRRCDDDTIGEGCAWYDGYAQRLCRRVATVGDLSEAQATGLVCAYNINASWQGGLTIATEVAASGEPYGLPMAKAAAQRILAGDSPCKVLERMPKIGRFYRNIALRDHEVVTVDRWAARAAGLDSNPRTLREYEAIELAYQDAAAELGLAPAMTQAIAWIAVRGGST